MKGSLSGTLRMPWSTICQDDGMRSVLQVDSAADRRLKLAQECLLIRYFQMHLAMPAFLISLVTEVLLDVSIQDHSVHAETGPTIWKFL